MNPKQYKQCEDMISRYLLLFVFAGLTIAGFFTWLLWDVIEAMWG